jgi:mRNA-degrading endonuclease RelE of RelBE toxin-antitoxin system
MSGFWRYRASDVRILCLLEFDQVVVVVVAIAPPPRGLSLRRES